MERVRAAGADCDAAFVIEFGNVSKTYKSILGRSVKAVEDFSLSIPAGEVFGLAGPNGAGKSTLVGMVLGFLRPTSGSVTIGGSSPRNYVEQNGVGYLSELIAIPPHWRAEAALKRFAILGGVEEQQLHGTVDAAVARLGLEEHRGKRVKTLSKGNLQRVGIAQAISHAAEIYILDEPTHGLDPVWTQRFRDVINELRSPNRVILIASHNLDELQRLANRVAIIDHGRLQRVVSTKTSGGGSGDSTYRIVAVRNGDLIRAAFSGATEIAPGEFEILATPLEELNKTLARLMTDGLVVSSVVPAHSALEREFREAVGEKQ